MTIDPKQAGQLSRLIEDNIGRVMVGKRSAIHRLMIALASSGHVLLEDVPGIGKTTLVSALAKSLSLSFNRIQFTPDVMPSDVTGFNLYNPGSGKFEFQPGVIMTQLLLADEINRTSPKTQSALLEAMQENQVTVDGTTYEIPQPFMVLATQNPIEHVGTYTLPEAQLDRFMLKVTLGYPNYDEEMEILNRFSEDKPLATLKPVASANDVLWLREQAKLVYVSDAIKQYIVGLSRVTREHQDLELGISPRASLMLMQAAKAAALLDGRDYVIPDDVKAMIVPTLAHRLIIKPEGRLRETSAESILNRIVKSIPVATR
ncbi:MAG TPA: MoxR family ATPase [Fastidiosipila sp.]|jgi:MoxR-like ATPase|nr:MoxR family ATPase [Fastidiosipila sp.]